MRDYAKVSPQFWIGKTGKKIRAKGCAAQVTALYLMTSPHANMIGLYYLPKTYLAHETGQTIEGASEALSSLSEVGFCQYDEATEMVWVVEMAGYQVAEALQETDKRCKGIQKEYDELPENPYLAEFYDKYVTAFHMIKNRGASKGHRRGFKGPTKPRAGTGARTRAGTRAGAGTLVERQALERGIEAPAEKVFGYWQEVMQHPHAKLDLKREKTIRARFADGYSPEDLCLAVDGCKRDPFSMGENDRHTVFDDIELICRDGSHVDKFIKLAQQNPALLSMSAAGRKTASSAQEWLNGEGDGKH